MTTEIETTTTTEAPGLAEARARCSEAADAAAAVAADLCGIGDVPPDVHLFGGAIERTKICLDAIAAARSNLLEDAARVKAALADDLRGPKASLSEKDKRQLELLLEEDTVYQRAQSLAAEMQTLWGLWDARRSRLNRDYEIARIDYARAQATVVTSEVLDGLRGKLFIAADYFVSKLRSVR